MQDGKVNSVLCAKTLTNEKRVPIRNTRIWSVIFWCYTRKRLTTYDVYRYGTHSIKPFSAYVRTIKPELQSETLQWSSKCEQIGYSAFRIVKTLSFRSCKIYIHPFHSTSTTFSNSRKNSSYEVLIIWCIQTDGKTCCCCWFSFKTMDVRPINFWQYSRTGIWCGTYYTSHAVACHLMLVLAYNPCACFDETICLSTMFMYLEATQ